MGRPLGVAETVRFERTEPFGSTGFKPVALNHSATSPYRYSRLIAEEIMIGVKRE